MSFLRVRIRGGYRPFEDPELVMGGYAEEAAGFVLVEVENLMRASKSGRTYGSHVASAPGEAMAIWTGNLFEHYQVVPRSELEADLFNDLFIFGYGEILEDFKDRPVHEEATENAMDRINEGYIQRIEDAWLT